MDEIDEQVIAKFIQEFNDDSLTLDDTLFSFMTEDEDFEDED